MYRYAFNLLVWSCLPASLPCVCVCVCVCVCGSRFVPKLENCFVGQGCKDGGIVVLFFSGLLCVYTAAWDSWWVVPCQYLWLQGHCEVVCPVANIVYAVVLQKGDII